MQSKQHTNKLQRAPSRPTIRSRNDKERPPRGLRRRNGNNDDANGAKRSSHGKANRGNDDDGTDNSVNDDRDGNNSKGGGHHGSDISPADSSPAGHGCADGSCADNSCADNGCADSTSAASPISPSTTAASTAATRMTAIGTTAASKTAASSIATSTGSSPATTAASTSLRTSSSATTSISVIGAGSDRNGAQRFTIEPAIVTTSVSTASEALAPIVTTAVLVTVVTGPNSIVTSYVPLLTTTPLTSLLKSTLAGTVSTASTSTSSAVTSISTSSDRKHKTTSTEAEDSSSSNSSSNSSGNKGNSKGNSHKSSDKPLGATAERALISAGSIGAFIIVCFLIWLVWRAVQRQRRRKHARALATAAAIAGSPASPSAAAAIQTRSSAPALPRRLFESVVSRIPFLNRRRGTWHTLGNNASKETVAAVGSNNAVPPQQSAEFYSRNEKGLSIGPPPMPAMAYYGGDPSQQLGQQQQQQRQQHAAGAMVQGNPMAATSTAPSSIYSQQMAAPLSPAGGLTVPGGNRYGAPEVSGGLPAVGSYGGGASTVGDTLRSRMPDPFYNQSQLARQPSDAYDPMRRQVNRVSELSSLSSGFGDGEILLGMDLPPKKPQQPLSIPPIPSTPPPAATPTGAGHFSWMRASRFVPGSRRETVYTEASDDQPPRFRTVSSWVHQQTGRVRRAQQRSNASNDLTAGGATDGQRGQASMSADAELETTPGIAHPMPEEQRLTMMVDDGEEPRRPETVPAIQMNLK